MTPLLTDSHCHLDFPDFDGEHDDIIARAAAAGVHRMVTICTKMAALPIVQGLAERYDTVFFAAGTHPMSAESAEFVTAADLIDLSRHPKFVGIGETGLDYHYTPDSADIQKRAFAEHIIAAQETQLPLIIHARAADQDMIDILQKAYAEKPFSCVLHCFSSGPELAAAGIEMGFYLSMSGIAAFPKSQDLRDIFASAPLDRILVETDSPYLAPPPHRGKRNEPAYVAHTAAKGAEVFGLTLAEFAAATEANFERLFWKATKA
jgi:TatD DNase family protein